MRLLRDDSAQNALEYLLVIGGVVAAIALAFFGFNTIIAGVLHTVCASADPIGVVNGVPNCITP